MTLLDDMRANPYIRVRKAGPEGVYACNFTSKAFWKGVWDSQTITARGLFLDDDGEVVARGFDKFFNIGETYGYKSVETFVADAKMHEAQRIEVARKANGYLAIIAGRVPSIGDNTWDDTNPELLVFSKSGQTPYAKAAEDLLDAQLAEADRTRDQLARFLSFYAMSLAVEVIEARDPHLVDEGEPRLIALAGITNTEHLDIIEQNMLVSALTEFGFEVTTWSRYDLDANVVQARIDDAESDRDEGVVLRFYDEAQRRWYMTKVKGRYYSNAKRMRSILADYAAKGEFTAKSPRDEALMSLIEDHLDPQMVISVDDEGTRHRRLPQYMIIGVDGGEHLDMVSLLREHPVLVDTLADLD